MIVYTLKQEILKHFQAASVTMAIAILEIVCRPWLFSVYSQRPQDPTPSPESKCQRRWGILT